MNPLQKISITFSLVFLTAAILVQMLVPFPFGLMAALGLFITLPLIVKQYLLRYMGKNGGLSRLLPPKFDKTCLKCGWKTKKDVCPRCESRQFRYT